ncbi:MAG: hypothetical protein ACREV1_07645 [Gammaproteobacteria bacterium]
MNTHRCCEAASDSRSKPFAAPTTDRAPHRLTFARRCLDIAGWIVPGAILALMPKCPACLVAYLAVGTGLGLSLSTATYLRASLLILCIASLLYLVVRRLCRFVVVKETLRRRVVVPQQQTGQK